MLSDTAAIHVDGPCCSTQHSSQCGQDACPGDNGHMRGAHEGPAAAPSFVPGKNAEYLHSEYWDRRFQQVSIVWLACRGNGAVHHC